MSCSHLLGAGSSVTGTIQPFPSGRQKNPEASCPLRLEDTMPQAQRVSRDREVPIFPPHRMVQILVHCFMPPGPLQALAPRSGSHGNPGVRRCGSSADIFLPPKPVT